MDFSPAPEQLELQQSIREFAMHELGESLAERDAAARFSREYWNQCCRFGIQGMGGVIPS